MPVKAVTKAKAPDDTPMNVSVILKACNDDMILAEFFVEWIKAGKNAQAAYLKLHPDVTEDSAAVLGHRLLNKVNRGLIMQAYGLTAEKYFSVLREGLEADKWNDFTGEREPDHNVRIKYHDKLGKLSKIEDKDSINITNNIVIVPSDVAGKYSAGELKSSTEQDS